MKYEDIPVEVTIHNILPYTELSPVQLYGLRHTSRDMYKRYIDSLRIWVLDPESWMTAIKNDDEFLFKDLQSLMESSSIVIDEDFEYDSYTRQVVHYPLYLTSYKNMDHIGISVLDMIEDMSRNVSYRVFSIAMTNKSFRMQSYKLDSLYDMVILAIHNEETLAYLITMYDHDPESLLDIISISMMHSGDYAIHTIIDILLEKNIHIPRHMIEYLKQNIRSGMYHFVDIEDAIDVLDDFANTII